MLRVFLAYCACVSFLSCTKGSDGAAAPAATPGAAPQRLVAADAVKAAGALTQPVRTEEVGTEVSVPGQVVWDDLQVSHVFAPLSGRVVRIKADVGQQVRKGDVLALVESPDAGTLLADYDKARADLALAESSLRRQQILAAGKAGTAREFELARDAAARAKAEYLRTEEKIRLLRGQDDDDDDDMEAYSLRSSIAGVVTSRQVNPGAEIQGLYSGGSSTELFTVANLSTVWVLSDLPEAEFGRVQPGLRVEVQVTASPGRVYAGVVDWLSAVETRGTARIRCVIDNQDGELRPGMFASVNIFAVSHERVLAIPRAALLRPGEKTMVLLQTGPALEGGLSLRRTPVVVDEDVPGELVPVKHGLKEGDVIVVRGARALGEQF